MLSEHDLSLGDFIYISIVHKEASYQKSGEYDSMTKKPPFIFGGFSVCFISSHLAYAAFEVSASSLMELFESM